MEVRQATAKTSLEASVAINRQWIVFAAAFQMACY
jgi:hypothetical protein